MKRLYAGIALAACGIGAFSMDRAGAQAIPTQTPPQTQDPGGGGFGFGLSFHFGGPKKPKTDEIRDARLPDFVPDQVIFLMDNGKANPNSIAQSAHVTIIESISLLSLSRIMVTAQLAAGDTPSAAIDRLQKITGVAYAQPNHLYQVMGDSGTKAKTKAPKLPRRFALEAISGDPVSGVIAMIDTPVAGDHEVFSGASVQNEFYGESKIAGAHGTAVASLIAGNAQIYGSARGAKLLSLSAFSQNKDGTAVSQTRYIAKALDAAALRQPDILALAFGGDEDRLLSQLLDIIASKGICVAAAAGNGGAKSQTPFPATHRASLVVTAVDEKQRIYGAATPGTRIDVAGIGVDQLVAVPGGYRNMSGTSFATAFVAGALLQMPQCSRAHDPAAMRSAAIAHAKDIGASGKDSIFGAGLFRIAAGDE